VVRLCQEEHKKNDEDGGDQGKDMQIKVDAVADNVVCPRVK